MTEGRFFCQLFQQKADKRTVPLSYPSVIPLILLDFCAVPKLSWQLSAQNLVVSA